MTRIVRALAHCRRLWWSSAREAEMAEEMRQHLQQRIEEHVAGGLSPHDARTAALRQFGNIALAQELAREEAGGLWLSHAAQDLRYAVRVLRRNPVFSAAAIATLALGLSVNTSLFSIFHALVLRPLPVPQPSEIVSVYQSFSGELSRSIHGSPYLSSYQEYVAYRDDVAAFSELVAYRELEAALDTETNVRTLLVSDNYFDALRSPAAVGRVFHRGDAGSAGAPALAVLSHAFWRQRFGESPRAVGATIRLNGHAFSIVGVADADLHGTELQSPDVWIPLTMQPAVMPGREYLSKPDAAWLSLFGRLNTGVSLQTARAQLATVAARADSAHPGRRTTVIVRPGALLSSPAATGKGTPLALGMMVIGGLVTLIASANIATLLLSRAAARRRELGVRLALGASRGRLFRQVLTETLLLGLLGAVAAVVASYWLPSVWLLVVPDRTLRLDTNPSAAVMFFSAVSGAAAGLLTGLLPARLGWRLDPWVVLRGDAGWVAGRSTQSRAHRILAIVQVAIAFALLVGAGLLLRSLTNAQRLDLGFDARDLVMVTSEADAAADDDSAAGAARQRLLQRVREVPGVVSAALVATPPFKGSARAVVAADAGDGFRERTVQFNAVSPGFFATLGIPVTAGRTFAEGETVSRVAVVSRRAAEQLWPGGRAVGGRLRLQDGALDVVGVVADVNTTGLPGVVEGTVYVPAASGRIVVRVTPGSDATIAAALMEAARGHVNGGKVSVRVERLADSAAAVQRPLAAGTQLALTLGVLAMILAAVGLYGVVSYGVARRQTEMGVRIALGATPRRLIDGIVKEGVRLAAIGTVAGCAFAIPGGFMMRATLVGVSPVDPLTYGTVAVFVCAVAALASYVPAARAARRDPLNALRAS